MVTEVDELLPRLQRLVADDRERHHGLDSTAVTRLQAREAELAGVAAEDDAPRHRRDHAGLGSGFEVAVALTKLRDGVGHRHRDGVRTTGGIRPLGDQPLTLGETDCLLLSDLCFRGFGGVR